MTFTEKAEQDMKGCDYTDEETGFTCMNNNPEFDTLDKPEFCGMCEERIKTRREDLQAFYLFLENLDYIVNDNQRKMINIKKDISNALKVLDGEKS